MDAVPDNAVKVVLSVVVPCFSCNGTGRNANKDTCNWCLGAGIRTVVTDVEVTMGDRGPKWVRSSEPHMDGSHTISVDKYQDGRPGIVNVRVPAGYGLVRLSNEEKSRD